MTWNGLQGFQTPIEDETFLVDNMGVFGNAHTERGLTCQCTYYAALVHSARSANYGVHRRRPSADVEFYYSGHMTPRKFSGSLSLRQ